MVLAETSADDVTTLKLLAVEMAAVYEEPEIEVHVTVSELEVTLLKTGFKAVAVAVLPKVQLMLLPPSKLPAAALIVTPVAWQLETSTKLTLALLTLK